MLAPIVSSTFIVILIINHQPCCEKSKLQTKTKIFNKHKWYETPIGYTYPYIFNFNFFSTMGASRIFSLFFPCRYSYHIHIPKRFIYCPFPSLQYQQQERRFPILFLHKTAGGRGTQLSPLYSIIQTDVVQMRVGQVQVYACGPCSKKDKFQNEQCNFK